MARPLHCSIVRIISALQGSFGRAAEVALHINSAAGTAAANAALVERLLGRQEVLQARELRSNSAGKLA